MADITTALDMGYISPKEISENAGTIFAHATDGEKSWEALFASLELFRRVAIEAAKNLDYEYLNEVDKSISSAIRNLSDKK